jgi:hypothetical protein
MADDVFGLPSEGSAAEAPEFARDEPQAADVEVPEEKVEELYPGRPEPAEAPERPRGPDGRFLPKEDVTQPMAEGQKAPEGLEEASAEAKKAWAGKYQSPEAMEKGYRELRDLQRRTAERAKAYEQRVAEVEFQARQMEDAVRRATDYVRNLQQQQQQQLQPQVAYDEMGNPIQLPSPGLSPQQVQEYVDAQLQERLALEAQARQEQAWRQEKYLEAQEAQRAFFEAHPDVERNGDVDEDIASTILAFNEAWQSIDGSTFNLGSEESLAIAYEASNRPALRTVLEKQPQLMDDDGGMTLARALANQIDGGDTTPQMAPQVGRMTAQTNTPFAERGSSPAPQQASPLDEFDQAVAEYRQSNRVRGSKVFFGE